MIHALIRVDPYSHELLGEDTHMIEYARDAVISAGHLPVVLSGYGDEQTETMARSRAWAYYAGPPTDNISAVINACRAWAMPTVMLVPASPWISPAEMAYLALMAVTYGIDYASNCTYDPGIPGRQIEVLSIRALDWLDRNAVGNGNRQGVTVFIKRHLKQFVQDHKILSYREPLLPAWIPKLTIDCKEDLEHQIDAHKKYRKLCRIK